MTPPLVSVIIPCLDEAANAARYPRELFDPLGKVPFGCEVIFSDGGSSDGTPGAVREAAAGLPWVKVIEPDSRTSFAESISRAIPHCAGTYIAMMEADLSFSPLDLQRLVRTAEAGACDCVCGSPFLGSFEGLPAPRRALTSCANFLFRLRFGRSVTSYTQIFKLYRADILRRLDFRSTGFTVDAELTAACLARGCRMAEVPVKMTARTLGTSKLKASSEIAASLRLLLRGVPAGV